MNKPELRLAEILFGYGCFELGGKYCLALEQSGGGTSFIYILMLTLSSFGVVLGLDGCVKLWRLVTVKEDLNKFTKQSISKDKLGGEKRKMKFLQKLRRNERASISAKSIIALAVGFVLMATLLPIGLDQVYAANTTLWETAVTTIFTLVLPIVVVIAGALSFLGDVKS